MGNPAVFKAKFNEEDALCAKFTEGEQLDAKFGSVQKVATTDYNELYNKPSINEVELKGNKTFEDLGDKTLSNIEIKAIFDRVFGG